VNLVHGNDLAWGGWGWCLATEQGPLSTGHVKLGGLAWRWPGVARYLDGPISHELAEAEMMRRAHDSRVRIVIEEPPACYSGASRGGAKGGKPKAGNQAKTGYGLGTLAGAVALWSAQRPELAYPWFVEPTPWRAWWSLGGNGRLQRKIAARDLVRALGWGRFLDPFPWDPAPEAAGGAQGDVADAILLSVGAARHADLAPRGPAQRTLADASTRR